jgi:Cu(I)/Ag(I) efflux system membrane fusion protein/cobalt-zinc-cadmium efflux system membrane fusion protein
MSMKKTISVVLMVAAGAAGGWLANGLFASAPTGPTSSASGTGACPGGAEPIYWKAPMDPSYVRDAPGQSPMGMDLLPVCEEEGDELPKGAVRINPGMIQNMGVRTALVERRDLTRVVRAVARVAFDERLVEHVHIKVQGWIEKLYVKYEGEMVKRGQPLLELYSPELVSTQEELLIAARYRDATGDSPFPDVKRGGDDLFEATRRRLELWDIPQRDIDQLLDRGIVRKTLTLYAPAGGVVTHLMVRKGMEVGANDNLYTISNLSRVWVYADVYEYELAWINEGQRGVVELSYLPGVALEGVVTYIYPYLDPKTRTARVRLELDNPDGVLKPDMFANVSIEAETRKSVIAVPDEAVIRSGRRNLIVVALGDGRFQPRDVTLGLDTGDGWLEVRDGLRESERVVTSGQFLIDSESKLREAFQKILASGGDSTDLAAPTDSSVTTGLAMKTDSADGAEHSVSNGEMEGASHEGHAIPAEAASAAEQVMSAGETSHDGHNMRPDSNEPKE